LNTEAMNYLSTFLSLSFLLFSLTGFSQTRSVILSPQWDMESKYLIDLEPRENSLALSAGKSEGLWISAPIALPDMGEAPFYMYALRWEGAELTPMVRFSEDGIHWGKSRLLEKDGHFEEEGVSQTELYSTSAENRFLQIRVRLEGDEEEMIENVEIYWCNPGKTKGELFPLSTMRSDTTPCPIPAVLTREEWCPAGNCFPDPTPQPTEVTHLIVHHSAGSNTSSDWAAVVRAIWDFHVNFNGWDDIGYNWLIDPNGAIYEGRGNDLQGAHFCGFNSFTAGICMLGTYTDVIPTGEARRSLVELLAWKCGDKDLNPLGVSFHPPSNKNLNTISGHRDGCSTECPGNAFYPVLEDIRQATSDYIQNDCFLADVASTSFERGLSVSPNPFTEELSIQLPEYPGNWSYTFYALGSGQLMWQGQVSGSNSFSLRLTDLPQAAYLLVLEDQGTGRIFREKVFKF
jgi:hypothetical protein